MLGSIVVQRRLQPRQIPRAQTAKLRPEGGVAVWPPVGCMLEPRGKRVIKTEESEHPEVFRDASPTYLVRAESPTCGSRPLRRRVQISGRTRAPSPGARERRSREFFLT